jgi:hypothetical protein
LVGARGFAPSCLTQARWSGSCATGSSSQQPEPHDRHPRRHRGWGFNGALDPRQRARGAAGDRRDVDRRGRIAPVRDRRPKHTDCACMSPFASGQPAVTTGTAKGPCGLPIDTCGKTQRPHPRWVDRPVQIDDGAERLLARRGPPNVSIRGEGGVIEGRSDPGPNKGPGSTFVLMGPHAVAGAFNTPTH